LWINGIKNIDSIPTSQIITAPSIALTQGSYTWYINAYDNVGNIRQSSQTWTFYVDWETPTAFTLISPTDSQIVSISRPTFMWHPSFDIGSGLTKYELNISGYSPIVLVPTDTTYTIIFDLPNGIYSWFINAFDLAGSTTSSDTLMLILNVPPPDQPTIPIGTDTLCINSANTVYTTTGANYATSYVWSITPSTAGTITGTGATAIVNWNNTFTGTATITVQGQNSCCNGIISNPLTILINPLPDAAGTIIGATTVCQGQSSVTYNVSTINNATSYVWSLPSSATGTSTSDSIIVNYGISAVSGNITVKGANTCGDGTLSNLAITVNTIPDTPSITLNGNILHSDAITGNQWYQNGFLITGATNQNYTVTVNDTYYTIVTINNCSSIQSNSINVALTGISLLYNDNSVIIYPNPVMDIITIDLQKISDLKNTHISIYNLQGQLLLQKSITQEKTELSINNLAKGMYIVKVYNNNNTMVTKFVKE